MAVVQFFLLLIVRPHALRGRGDSDGETASATTQPPCGPAEGLVTIWRRCGACPPRPRSTTRPTSSRTARARPLGRALARPHRAPSWIGRAWIGRGSPAPRGGARRPAAVNILVVYLAALMLNPAVTLDAGASVTEGRVLLAMLLLQARARARCRGAAAGGGLEMIPV